MTRPTCLDVECVKMRSVAELRHCWNDTVANALETSCEWNDLGQTEPEGFGSDQKKSLTIRCWATLLCNGNDCFVPCLMLVRTRVGDTTLSRTRDTRTFPRNHTTTQAMIGGAWQSAISKKRQGAKTRSGSSACHSLTQAHMSCVIGVRCICATNYITSSIVL